LNGTLKLDYLGVHITSASVFSYSVRHSKQAEYRTFHFRQDWKNC